MSSNISITPIFGRFNWNISQEVSFTLSTINDWINYFGAFYELTVVIFFIVKFCQKKSGFREPYYIIYTFGCFCDAIPKILNFFVIYVNPNIVVICVYTFFQWYNPNLFTLWNLLLALNRFIAILFTLQFSKIWSKRNTTIICVFLILYPFVIHLHNPLYLWCQIIGLLCPRSLRMTNGPTKFEYVFAFVSEITYAFLATVLCTIAALKIVIKKQMKNQNVEKVLLIQSFTSSVFLVLSTAFSWLASVNGSLPGETDKSEIYRGIYLQSFLNVISSLFYNLHHYIGLLMLLVMSRSFRTKYFEFYQISMLWKLCTKPIKPKSDSTNTVVVAPASTNATPRVFHVTSTFLH